MADGDVTIPPLSVSFDEDGAPRVFLGDRDITRLCSRLTVTGSGSSTHVEVDVITGGVPTIPPVIPGVNMSIGRPAGMGDVP